MNTDKKILVGIGLLAGALGLYLWTRKAAADYIPSCSDCDLNGDGYITGADFSILAGHYGETGPPGWIKADINRDGVIDEKDEAWLQHYFGQKC